MNILESMRGIGPSSFKTSSNTPFEVTIDEWRIIKSYAKQITEMEGEAEGNVEAFFSSFETLKKCAVKWEDSTFLNIIGLSDCLYRFGIETVKTEYGKLKDILGSLEGAKPSEQLRLLLHDTISTCINEIENIINLSSIVVDELIEFSNSIEDTYKESQQYMHAVTNDCIVDIGSHSQIQCISGMDIIQKTVQAIAELSSLILKLHTPPLADMQRFRGAWVSLKDDLNYIDVILSKEIEIDDTFIASINVSVAISEWEKVAMEAYDFSNNAKVL